LIEDCSLAEILIEESEEICINEAVSSVAVILYSVRAAGGMTTARDGGVGVCWRD